MNVEQRKCFNYFSAFFGFCFSGDSFGFGIDCKLRKILFGIVEIEVLIGSVWITKDCAVIISFQQKLQLFNE